MPRKINLNKFIIVLFLLSAIGYLAYQNIKYDYHFGKELTVEFIPGEENQYISKFALNEPVEIIGYEKESKKQYQIINLDDTYFELMLPKWQHFNQAVVDVEYQNPDVQPEIKLALMKPDNSFIEYPIAMDNPYLDALSEKEWQKITQDNLILWRRLSNNSIAYSDIDYFLADLPESKRILTFNYSFPKWARLADYRPSVQNTIINQPLRGEYDLYTYIKDEQLNFNFELENINTSIGQDYFFIQLFHEGEFIREQKYELPSPGLIFSDKKSAGTSVQFQAYDLTEGVYQLVIQAPDDVLTRQIKTSQQKIAFSRRLFLAGDAYYQKYSLTDWPQQPAQLQFNGTQLKFKTLHTESLQTVTVAGEKIELQKDDKYYFVQNIKGTNNISLEKNDLLIESAGYFSFNQETFFIPEQTIGTRWEPGTDLGKYNYILARYTQPIEQEQWFYASNKFDLHEFEENNRVLRFFILAPGLSNDERKLYISKINIKLIQ